MAQGLLSHALSAEPEPLRSLRVVSAGVAANDGDLVSENTVIALKKVGIDVAHLRSQSLNQALLDKAVAVFGMTESHRAMIRARARPVPEHLYLVREFMPPPASPEIGDPYGGPLRLYESVRDEMVEAVPSIVEFLRKLVAKPAGAK